MAASPPPAPATPATPTGAASNESPIALKAYLRYEAMGAERSFPKLVAALRSASPQHYRGTAITLLRNVKKWASDHRWRERTRAFDLESERQHREAAEAALAKMNDEQALMARCVTTGALTRIRELLALDQDVINDMTQARLLLAQGLTLPPPLHDLLTRRPRLYVGATSLVELWRSGVEVERLARGAATEIAQQQHSGGLHMTITTATPDGREVNASPFGHDPNALLAADLDGKTADDDDEDEEGDTEDVAGDGAPDDADETSGPARPGALNDEENAEGADTPPSVGQRWRIERRVERRERPAAEDTTQNPWGRRRAHIRERP